jgi:1-acyl-sn-glycerol-3-phosphate acyltransferase
VIPARKSPWFRRWFAAHAAGRMRATFEAVRVAGAEHLRAALAAGPAVLVSNHTAWWDPLVALVLTERLAPCDSFAMMDAVNLVRLPFLGRIGAFGVDRRDPADGPAVIAYAAALLDRPGRAVWVFPQGRERPVTERPLAFRRGSAEIARSAAAVTVPLALRYEFGGTERPQLLVDIGPPVAPEGDVETLRARQEAAVTEALERIDAALRGGSLERYDPVIRASAGALGRVAERALAWLTRPRRGLTPRGGETATPPRSAGAPT